MKRFTEKVEYKEAMILKAQGDLGMMLADVQSYLDNMKKDFTKTDYNQDVIDELIKNMEESTVLVKSIFK